jgi:SAM-dependent methyltransferase
MQVRQTKIVMQRDSLCSSEPPEGTGLDAVASSAPRNLCPLCGASCDSSVRFVSKYGLTQTEEIEIPWLRCSKCGTYSMREIPTSEEVLAHVALTQYGRAEFAETIGKQKQRLHAQILHELLRVNPSAKTVLDFGCSFGVFLRMAQEHGLSAYGLDANPLAIAATKSQGGEALLADNVSAAEEFGIHFSAIVMNDVICYVQRPLNAFRKSLRLLEPGGVLILRVSNKAFWLSLGLRMPGLTERVVEGCCHDHFHVAGMAAYLSALKRVGFATVKAGDMAMSTDFSEQSVLGRAIYGIGHTTNLLTRGRLRIDPGILVIALKGA